MAYIQERTSEDGKISYRVQVRLKGFPLQTATFARKTDAKDWGQRTETAIREGRHFKTIEAKRHTLKELIERYSNTHLKQLKSSNDRKRQLDWWKKELGEYTLVDIRPALISEKKDELGAGETKRGSQRVWRPCRPTSADRDSWARRSTG